MRKILIIANTYYQLIIAIQMRYTLFHEDKVTLLLSDLSRNSDNICREIKERNIFSESYYLKTPKMKEAGFPKKFFQHQIVSCFQKSFNFSAALEKVATMYFDEFIFFNYASYTYKLFSRLYKINKNIKVSRYEEGILAYSYPELKTPAKTVIKIVRRCLGKKDISEAYSNFYCFYPELYCGDLNPVQVPCVSENSACANSLKSVFGITEDKLSYPEKYIFFTSVLDFEGGEAIGEYEIVCRVAELVGKENLLIKTHPRDKRALYIKNGFNVDRNSDIPWEAIQLSGDFSDKVFLTATSGSVLAGSFMADDATRTFYMHRLCNLEKNPAAKKSAEDIENLLRNEKFREVLKKVSIVETVEEITQ